MHDIATYTSTGTHPSPDAKKLRDKHRRIKSSRRTFLTLLNRSRNEPSFEKILTGLFLPFFDTDEEPDEAGIDTGEGEADVCEPGVANDGMTGVLAGVERPEEGAVAETDI